MCGELGTASENEVLESLEDFFSSHSNASRSAFEKRRDALGMLVGHYVFLGGEISIKHFVYCVDREEVGGMNLLD